MDITPAVHLHVSGSAGTTLCNLARRQRKGSVAGSAYNCLAPWTGHAAWLDYSLRPTAGGGVTFYSSQLQGAGGNCKALEDALSQRGYGVIAEMETFMPESNNSEYPALLRQFTRHAKRSHSSCEDAWKGPPRGPCCNCTTEPFLLTRRPSKTSGGILGRVPTNLSSTSQMLVVERGAVSHLESWWPLDPSGRWLATYCSNLKYTFLMHEPLSRVAARVLETCGGRLDQRDRSCVAWARETLTYVYSKDLVLLNVDGQATISTPFVSNMNIRFLLGVRTFFSRLHALKHRHWRNVAKAVLSRFTLVAPVDALADASSFGRVLRDRLHWPHANTLPRSNVHGGRNNHSKAIVAALLEGEVGDLIREHNAPDLELFAWVQSRYAADLKASTGE